MKKKILFILTGVIIFSTGCSNSNKSKNEPSDYSYNVIADNNRLTDEEQTKKNITEIYNVGRGYINSWNTANVTYMGNVIDDTVNGVNKEEYIKQYRKDIKRMYMKKYVDTIQIIEYKNDTAKLKVVNKEIKANNITISPYPECKETLIFTLIYKNNKWVITNIDKV